MKRKQFTFYESFYQAIECLPTVSQKVDAYDAICDYALNGVEPDMERLKPNVRLVLSVCMPVLSAANRKAEAAQRGAQTRGSITGGDWQRAPKNKVPMGSGELGEAERAAIRKMLAE